MKDERTTETKAPELSAAAKAARKLYHQAWEHANKDKRRAINAAFWERRANELIAEGILTEERVELVNRREKRRADHE